MGEPGEVERAAVGGLVVWRHAGLEPGPAVGAATTKRAGGVRVETGGAGAGTGGGNSSKGACGGQEVVKRGLSWPRAGGEGSNSRRVNLVVYGCNAGWRGYAGI